MGGNVDMPLTYVLLYREIHGDYGGYMTTVIHFLGGDKNGQKARMDLDDLPERGEGGEYIYFSSFGLGACDPAGPFPEPTSHSAVWVADA